jgi:hypothetical protein
MAIMGSGPVLSKLNIGRAADSLQPSSDVAVIGMIGVRKPMRLINLRGRCGHSEAAAQGFIQRDGDGKDEALSDPSGASR